MLLIVANCLSFLTINNIANYAPMNTNIYNIFNRKTEQNKRGSYSSSINISKRYYLINKQPSNYLFLKQIITGYNLCC